MSNSKKEDPRAIRSKRMFKEAIVSLMLEERSLSHLTVQKIASRAELNRATFYLHFEDVSDLLRQLADEVLNGLSEKIQPLEQSDPGDEQERLTVFLDSIYDKRKLLAVLFDSKSLETNLFHLLKTLIETRRWNKRLDRSSHPVALEIRTASIMGIIMWWIRDGIQFSPAYIADQITLLFGRKQEGESSGGR
ncbi:TetR/AcrR family transcriptional regulator [Paenibacillus albicereus]|uniref:TetR/AcrR family transcriptional regulator n=1 Tax=Paenibacillus albicereus TaxID=2726185 RepID=A0A6H2GXJ4_9BACL|nr:TetR/AcrR family transcriptional regulator [Paenibacillus albicereus]QJC52079.1 TetR/AcrR family transcriptional regulator [Paenibacillus albicereus]